MDSDRPPSQQQLKQLQQQYPQQRALQQQALQGPHLSADHPPVAAHTDTWPWRAPAPAPATGSAVAPTSTAVLTHDYSSMTSSPSTSMTDYPSASSYQPAAPQLDGAFLAECFKSPGLAAAAHKLAWQNLPNQTLHSQNMLKQNLLRQGLPCQNSPNASMASSRHCFTSSSSPPASSGSCMPALQPEALHHSPMHPTEVSPLGDTLGELPLLSTVELLGLLQLRTLVLLGCSGMLTILSLVASRQQI